MSSLSPNALAFIPLADLLIQLQSLINQLQPRLLSSDMNFSSDQTTSTPKSFPSTFPSYRVFKRYQRAKLWRSKTNSTKQTTTIPNSTSVRPSPQFFKYLHDFKTGKVKIGESIQSTTPSSISEKLGVIDSVNSRVISSPLQSYSPRNPPIHRLPSVSTSSSHTTIILDEIPIPAWPSHYSKVFKLFHSSSFDAKGCMIPEPSSIFHIFLTGIKFRDKDTTSVTLSEYFHYSLFHCSTSFCSTHLKCCYTCGLSSHSDKRTTCSDPCSDCPSTDHKFHSCPKFLSWLHHPQTPYHLAWMQLVTNWFLFHPPPAFKD